VTRMSQAQDQQALSKFLRFARCMHSHGVPGWPDPTRAPGQIPPLLSTSRTYRACNHVRGRRRSIPLSTNASA
jgi:hypothetical protein